MVSLEFVAKRYSIAVESVQKETVSRLQRDCPARATHPGAVDHILVKQLGVGE
jgi:spore coat polysaccharide biosynthesis protein SpsF (cytidylyltransferase family)